MPKFIPWLFFLFPLLLPAQSSVLHIIDRSGEKDEVTIKSGSLLRIKLTDESTRSGKLDSLFADGMLVAGDTILFDKVEKIKYRYQDRGLLKGEASLACLGIAVSGLMMAVASSMSDEEAASSTTGKGFLLFLISTPFLVHSGIASVKWYHKNIGERWYLYASIENE